MREVTYLLPVRSTTHHPGELDEYLANMAKRVRVVVVDASPDDVFDRVHASWSEFATHVRPAPDVAGSNGKVVGVLSGLRLVDTDIVVIGDDDIRYSFGALERICAAMNDADLVMPQNYFDPHRWHTLWDTSRTLLHRSASVDFAGTIAVRRSFLDGGYDPDVMFENLELIRCVAQRGGRCVWLAGCYVLRRPPTTDHFVRQRVRQAYDEWARPLHFAVELAIIPVGMLLARRPATMLLAGVTSSIVMAEFGRRRHGGRLVFPARSSLLAPCWLLERGVCSWVAAGLRLRGGVHYGDTRLRRASSRDGRWTPSPWSQV